ncbi:hypothetical protein NECAME_13559 [Necator americanus]|uniref:Uncharacterized protein n=1 Tax=Necator americanus TaxID=51031 RepID=W2SUX0_NECAM|nr:hypothetical protein NECAME_13559 [Necator americanus]ETN73298.1 hypothetical protein NECAME_13559 [Necator americanus]
MVSGTGCAVLQYHRPSSLYKRKSADCATEGPKNSYSLGAIVVVVTPAAVVVAPLPPDESLLAKKTTPTPSKIGI